jgi:hypothetical protein
MLVIGNAIVVNGSSNVLGGSRLQRAQHKHTVTAGQADHRASRIVSHANYIEDSASMLEELLYRGAQARLQPDAAKTPVKRCETLNQYGSVQGAAKSTADECGNGMHTYIDGLIHRCNFGDRDATANSI